MITSKKTHTPYSLKHKQSSNTLKFGRFGVKSLSFGKLTKDQLDSIQRSLLKTIKNNKKAIKVWFLVLFNLTLTKLSSESRMGKGKGAIYSKAIFLRPGTILIEFEGVSDQQMSTIFDLLKKTLKLKIALVKSYNIQ
uniref:Ribosomal protein L16 n=1 Tax=Mastocarpus papillatus TaxID=31436 RepID=A0A342RZ58_9FLOR|nr:ribosomal protein L16 [Mastocarpus papillatus]AOL58004.1 ribosomal protein L16 [Mastocarpus papillatus]